MCFQFRICLLKSLKISWSKVLFLYIDESASKTAVAYLFTILIPQRLQRDMEKTAFH